MVLDTLYWEITDKCPLFCKHCYQGKNVNSSRKILDLEENLRRVDVLANNGIKILLLTGGEPLINKNIYEIIKRSRSRGLDTAILTSGYLITKGVAKKLAEVSPNAVQISLDGIGEVHDAIRGKGVFKRVEKAINYLGERDIPHYMKMTMNKLNFFDIQNVVEYCHNQGLRVNFSNALSIGTAREKGIALEPHQYFDAFIMLHEKKYVEGRDLNLPDFALEEYLNGEQVKSMCSAGRRIAVLTFDDLFFPCPFIAGLGLNESDGVLTYSDDVISKSKEDKLFNVLRRHNEVGFDCPLRKLDGDKKDAYSLQSFVEYTGGKYGPIQR
jgi:MoaA/NifB/PqqE/SkfB family radical SAM enzyme